jgi:acetylornithine deacetylase/succinyl-diaminopimelate desuccinylase-like protein
MEEEVGSPSLEGLIQRKAASLRSDSVLVTDTNWISREQPTVVYGLRGLLGMQLALQTHERDLHSGSVGGVARNPLSELGQVLARCQDPRTGRVTIPGFTDGIQPLTRAEMEGFLRSGITVEGFRKTHGLTRIRPSIRSLKELIRALTSEPTFEVHGISGGYAGPGIKTVIPHRAEALISMRLVPRQDPGTVAQRVMEFLMKENPDLEVSVESILEPFLGEFSGPFADATRDAMRYGFRKEPVFWRNGGSIGAVTTLRRHLRAPVSMLGLSLPSDRPHGINEHFEWRQAAGGIRMLVRYLDAISRIPGET